MFERFTGEARQVVVLAQEAAYDLDHHHIGTEHLLLGLLAGEDDVAATTLAHLGVTREGVLATRCMQIDSNDHVEQDCLAVMPRLKQALENAVRIAERLEQRVPGTEHLLAGAVAVPGALAVELLKQAAGVRPRDVHAELATRLGVEAEQLVIGRPRRRRLLAKAS